MNRPDGVLNETHLPTQQARPQASAWLSCAHGNRGWPPCAGCAPRQRPQSSHRLGLNWPAMSGVNSLPLVLERITRRADFLRANAGRKHITSAVIIRMIGCPAPQDSICRVGFTVSRACGNAVFRNRIKRRLRALVQEIWPSHARAGFDYVLIGRAGAEKLDYDKIRQELMIALRRLHG